MTTKSLTITEDAYDALKALKCGDESFSETILRISKDKIGEAAKLFGAWRDHPKEIKELRRRVREHRRAFDRDIDARRRRLFARTQ